MNDLIEYGNEDTWHDSKHLDVEIDVHGNVVAVWFRCQMLPFKEHIVDNARANDMAHAKKFALPDLVAVTLRRPENG